MACLHVCPHCLSEKFEWKAVSGRGTVHSSIVFHQIYNQSFAGGVPYNVSLVQLQEGPRMISNVVGIPPAEVKVGDRVQVVFDPVTPEISARPWRARSRRRPAWPAGRCHIASSARPGASPRVRSRSVIPRA